MRCWEERGGCKSQSCLTELLGRASRSLELASYGVRCWEEKEEVYASRSLELASYGVRCWEERGGWQVTVLSD